MSAPISDMIKYIEKNYLEVCSLWATLLIRRDNYIVCYSYPRVLNGNGENFSLTETFYLDLVES